ncbi:D-alanyl-D-alanine carboxypeptidase/D-alanyl-D-alanine endopeptidase [Roseospira marina]|nr:D-alanyl-D-alanine carboxypeptidase/D-alanyl-D-alanine-endopeptidase [Roseospira marina]MBB4314469.1 D-alanyl-D-alanine carboxypeptidase/D-alanyl-D-alanine-endopeptidase (penicillin-binding protein 4) [Roseospira marina]MBB5087629.1 D-alanyl-D-alanine carboxypeptidase/D-alanyl-D-alanine-endopeptidase (penicillin-binding protein 4) [Roseospira marina]
MPAPWPPQAALIRVWRRSIPGAALAPIVALTVALAAGAAAAQVADPPLPPPAKPNVTHVALTAAGIESGDTSGTARVLVSGAITDVALAMRPVAALPLPPGAKPAVPRATEADLIAAAGFDPDEVGYLVYDLDTGEYLAGHNATRANFLPASVMKVPTTVAALSVLGPDHAFPTLVRFDGVQQGGTWRGTLTLVGGGDPVLDSDDLRELVATLKAAGLERLDGAFVYDDSALIAATSLEPTQPAEFSYNPGLSALSLDFNRVRVQWDGDIVRFVETHGTPPVAPIRLERDYNPAVRWPAGGAMLRHTFAPPGTRDAQGPVTERWSMAPLAPPRGAMWLPVKAPAPFVAAVFRALADEADIALPEPAPALAPARGPIVAQHLSPRLDSIVAAGLKHSNNLVAELLGLATTRHLEGRPLPIADSAARLEGWLAETFPWVDWTGFHMANHSGLSPDSRASPEQIVSILRYAVDQHPRAVDYLALMPARHFPKAEAQPVASRVRAGGFEPAVWAKSGTMYHGRGLAGVARAASGNRLVFAVFTSDLEARAAFDGEYLHYTRGAVRDAKRELTRARDLEHALLLKWSREH